MHSLLESLTRTREMQKKLCARVCVCVCVCVCVLSCWIVSDSLPHYVLQPTWLLCPQSFSGKSTGVAMSFSRGTSKPSNLTHISCIAGGLFTSEPPGKPIYQVYSQFFTTHYDLVQLVSYLLPFCMPSDTYCSNNLFNFFLFFLYVITSDATV